MSNTKIKKRRSYSVKYLTNITLLLKVKSQNENSVIISF